MKSPFIILFALLSHIACVTSPNENEGSSDQQGEWSEDLPDRFFEEQNESPQKKAITSLRNPNEADFVEGDKRPKIFPEYHSSYNFLRADRTLTLPEELNDIAGLSFSPDGRSLIALNYKDGDIHYINAWKGELEKSIRFKRRGQYKGIQSVRNDIFIVKDNGSIFHVSELDSEKPNTIVYDTHLNAKFAVHGLTYHPIRNELLLACQGNAGDAAFDDSKSIYVFDLDSKELFRQPMFLIEDQDISDYINQFIQPEEEGDDLFYTPPKKKNFKPSAISINPVTDELFLISASSMQMIILSEDGELLHVEDLDPFLFTAPEGICFDLKGTVFISSKGAKGKTGKIFCFDRQRENRHPS